MPAYYPRGIFTDFVIMANKGKDGFDGALSKVLQPTVTSVP
jgi:hypothetical protein